MPKIVTAEYMTDPHRRLWTYSILAGIFIGTSYIPFPPWAIFFCFVPLWLFWLEAKTAKQVLLSGWITSFVLTLIGFNWVAYTVHEFGHLPWAVAGIALILFCTFSNLNIPIAGYLWFKIFRHSPRSVQIISLVVLTAIAERLYPMIFDWHFGYTWLWIGWPAFQVADTIGFVGLSSITIALNGCILWSHLLWQEKKEYWRPATAGVFLFATLNIIGLWKQSNFETPDKKAEVLIVQANIANSDKDYMAHGSNTKTFVIQKFFELTSKALEQQKTKPTFAIWPETAFPDAFYDKGLTIGAASQLHTFLAQKNLALVTGGYAYSAKQQLSNAMVVLDEKGEWVGPPYSKTHLLAWGEYIPGAEYFPFLKKWIPEIGDFVRGEGPTVYNLNGLRLGPQICYEGLFDSFSRGLAIKGAQIIVNSTNDSWYPDWNEPFQHLYMTLARAVETRRPLIRATNTGISTAVLASGEVLTLSPRGQEWSQSYEIPYLENPPQPPFLTWGFYLFPVILGLTLACLIIWRWRTWPKH